MLFATGAAARARRAAHRRPRTTRGSRRSRRRSTAVILDLAHQVVRDGEGARKFVEVTVEGAETDAAAKVIAFSIANSPLVKTAVGGRGRQLGPRRHGGRQGRRAGRARQAGDLVRPDPGRGPRACAIRPTTRRPSSAYMKGEHIDIRVELGSGAGRATVWTCDLTKAYVEINGDYRS